MSPFRVRYLGLSTVGTLILMWVPSKAPKQFYITCIKPRVRILYLNLTQLNYVRAIYRTHFNTLNHFHFGSVELAVIGSAFLNSTSCKRMTAFKTL